MKWKTNLWRSTSVEIPHQIEMYAAAFLREVGSKEASKYKLVQETSQNGLKRTWRFEKCEKSE